ncbi:TOBE domain-containing protein [Pseudomonas japonica]|uniref:TOBE domain-containing protein n=1 Tax=Pseudomonas japonica TaxID=256466 RepID=UPI0015E2D78F|nr:TOBE domain-containing protein [Pseudomonas japonica]MBA1242985.1 TOBE domain-containing protein [Pseudomonas japonica]
MSLPAALSHYLSHRPQRIALLQHIAEQGSITRAAKAAGLSYKGAWDAIDELNNLAARPLVERSVGGRGGGGARLSEEGQRLLRLYQRLQALQAQVLEAAEDSADLDLLGRLMLQTSARNQLAGTVASVEEDGAHDRVHLDLGGGLHICAAITRESTHRLHLTAGTHVVALMKAGWLTVHDRHAPCDGTANRLAAQVNSIEPTDAGSSEVRMNLPNGQTLCALVDNTTRHTLGLESGAEVAVSFEPGSVLLGRPF